MVIYYALVVIYYSLMAGWMPIGMLNSHSRGGGERRRISVHYGVFKVVLKRSCCIKKQRGESVVLKWKMAKMKVWNIQKFKVAKIVIDVIVIYVFFHNNRTWTVNSKNAP